MNNKGPIMIVDDDEDDRELIAEVFKKLDLGNEILFFADGQHALDYLLGADRVPFLILSDIQMTGLSGPELCRKIRCDDRLQEKHIPFVYFTTATTRNGIIGAYDVEANGLFIKPNSIFELQQRIGNIVSYWSDCHLPSDYL